mgnify:FL=1
MGKKQEKEKKSLNADQNLRNETIGVVFPHIHKWICYLYLAQETG